MRTIFASSYIKLAALIAVAAPIAMIAGWFHSGA
jgi:hypothetical protein